MDRGGRHVDQLAAREVGRAALGQEDRVALPVDVAWEAVDLVQREESHRHGREPGRAVGAGQAQDAAGELLREDGVARVARTRRRDALAQDRALLDQRVDPLLAHVLGHLDRRLHDEHGRGAVVHHVAEPVVDGLGAPHLAALHEDDLGDARARREGVHHLAQVRRARRTPAAALPRALGREDPVAVRPLGDGQRGIRPDALGRGASYQLSRVREHWRAPRAHATPPWSGAHAPRAGRRWRPGRRPCARAWPGRRRGPASRPW